MNSIPWEVWIALGLVVGALVTWVVLNARAAQVATSAAVLQERNTTLSADLDVARAQLREAQQEVAQLHDRATVSETELAAERAALEQRAADLDKLKTEMTTTFQALAAEALKGNNQSFLALAQGELAKTQTAASGDLQRRQEAIDATLKPVKESLAKFETQVSALESARVGAYAALNAQVEALAKTQNDLRGETGNLVKALRQPGTRGRWGEIQLHRVVEMAGMIPHVDFVEQATAQTDEGAMRPDMRVRLPGGKSVIVDAKTPIDAYLQALDVQDETARRTILQRYAHGVRDHLDKLSRKAYWDQFDQTPEFVVMFLPGENFFAAALEQDPGLIEYGASERIVIATPTTLIALLRAVHYGWSQEAIAHNAQAISDLGKELYSRLAVMSDHFSDLGKALGKAMDCYNKTVGSLEGRVLIAARRFRELRAVTGYEEIVELQPLEQSARELQAPEFANGGMVLEAPAQLDGVGPAEPGES